MNHIESNSTPKVIIDLDEYLLLKQEVNRDNIRHLTLGEKVFINIPNMNKGQYFIVDKVDKTTSKQISYSLKSDLMTITLITKVPR